MQAHQPLHDDCEILMSQKALPIFMFSDVRHKLHACCHGTHSMIEALRTLVAEDNAVVKNLVCLTIRVNPRWLKVCDIKEPRTGLEVKFSYAFLAAMVLHDIDTTTFTSYNDSVCSDAELAATARKVKVLGDESISDGGVALSADIGSGAAFTADFDLMTPIDIGSLETRLVAKAAALLGSTKANDIWASMAELETMPAAEIAQHLRP